MTTFLDGQHQDVFLTADSSGVFSSPGDTISKRSNVLANRVTNVLSSSYADSEVRDALRLLDARRKTTKSTEVNSRGYFKFDAQKDVIEANAKIVDDFGKVAKQLTRVGALITTLNQTCDQMRTHILLAKQETAPVLEEASTLFSRKHETETKQQLLDAFKQHFLILDEDLTTLTSSAEPVNDRFFAVLNRVKQIHKDCEILLGYENQRLGLELMEQTSRNLDAGYKKLYNWIQREFKGLDVDLENPHISASIRRSLRALSERPTLFQNCLDFFGEAREVSLGESFQKALTDSTTTFGTANAGGANAIEFSTHDPLRYIGDMLAWVHSTTVSEKEALEGLFISDADEISQGLNAGRKSEPWNRLTKRRTSSRNGLAESDDSENDDSEDLSTTFDGRAALNALISRNMATVSQTLYQRVSLTIRNLTDPISIYKAYNVLVFYEDIFMKLLGTNLSSVAPTTPKTKAQTSTANAHILSATNLSQNTLLSTLSSLSAQSLSEFQNLILEDIQSHATHEANVSSSTNPDLHPPPILDSNLKLLKTILLLRGPNLSLSEFSSLYGTLITPVLDICNEIAISLAPESPSSSTRSSPTPAKTRKPTHSTEVAWKSKPKSKASRYAKEVKDNGAEDDDDEPVSPKSQPSNSRSRSNTASTRPEIPSPSSSSEDEADDDNDEEEDYPVSESDLPSAITATIYRLNFVYPVLTTLSSLSSINSTDPSTLKTYIAPALKSANLQQATLQARIIRLLSADFVFASGLHALHSLLLLSSSSSYHLGDHDDDDDEVSNDKKTRRENESVRKRHTRLIRELDPLAQRLDSFLASALMDSQDSVTGRMRDKSLAKVVIAAVVDGFCARFEEVVSRLDELDVIWEEERSRIYRYGEDEKEKEKESEDEDNGEEEAEVVLLREVYPRTVEEVKALLS